LSADMFPLRLPSKLPLKFVISHPVFDNSELHYTL